LIYRRLLRHLRSRNFLSRFQAGFRSHYCTADQLFRLSHAISSAFAEHRGLPIAFLDLKNAFDTVWHDALLLKLHRAGVDNHLLFWIRSFLSHRSFFIQTLTAVSDPFPIRCGVPQGCVLSPLLFLVFINDACELGCCESAFFADDIALWPRVAGSHHYVDLQSDLSLLSRWADEWRLRFSSSKSNIIFFSRSSLNLPPPSYTLSSFTLSRADSYQYLGVHFQTNGGTQRQFQHVLTKAQRCSYLIRRLIAPNRPPNPLTIRSIVAATLIPAVTYGMQFWRPSQSQLHKLERLIVWPLRLSLHLPSDTRALSIFAEFNLLPLRLHRQLAILRLGARSGSLPSFHPCHRLLELPSVSTKRLFCRPLAGELRIICGLWRIDPTDFYSLSAEELETAAAEQQQLDFDATDASLKAALPTVDRNLSKTYLGLASTKREACKFAGFRFNRCRLRSLLFSRKQVDSPFCPACPSSHETVHHLFFNCPRFDAQRRQCFNNLDAILDIPLSLPLLLGEYGDVLKSKRSSVHRVISPFVLSIASSCHF
jgi:hypothetical protein